MRIGVIAPPWLPVPPRAYGGTETVIDALCRGLVSAGHEVQLWASGDSACPVELHSIRSRAPGIDVGGSAVELEHVISAYAGLRSVDVVHDHTTLGPVYSRSIPTPPVVTTNHNTFASPFHAAFAAVAGDVAVVAISEHHASTAGDVRVAKVIHHGVDPDDFPVGSGAGGYALFLGRLHPVKGAHRAVHAAVASGTPLIVAGRAETAIEREYVDEEIRPYLSESVRYVGEIGREVKLELLAGAACLLNPIAWDEPFGMVMIEALACGTPVVALRAGAAPEIVDHGRTGYVVESEVDLVPALESVSDLDRGACRSAVEGHFSQRRMVADYLDLYADVAGTGAS